MTTIGPTLPPSLSSKRKRTTDPETNSRSPSAKRSRSTSLTSSTSSTPNQPRTIGPAPPPAPLSELPRTSPTPHPTAEANDPDPDPSSSDSDSDFGPSLPPPPGTSSHPTEEASLNPSTAPPRSPAKPQREEWMLLPPTNSDWTARVDPTKLKNRRFNTSKSASVSKPKGGDGGIDTLWTETPEQKRQRLEDEVLGKKARATATVDAGTVGDDAGRKGREEHERWETEKRIAEFNAREGRGGSLYGDHVKSRDKKRRKGEVKGEKGMEEEDDPSKRAFDREKDMGLGIKIGYKARADMTREAKGFGGRFGAGGYL